MSTNKIKLFELRKKIVKKIILEKSRNKNSTNIKLDKHGDEVNVGDAIRIQVVSGPYGETDTYEGVIDSFDEFGNVYFEDNPNKPLKYTPYDKHNDYEHGHETWVELINQMEIDDSKRVKKQFVPTIVVKKDGEKYLLKGEDGLKKWLEENHPGAVFGNYARLYANGWRLENNYSIARHISTGEIREVIETHLSSPGSSGYLIYILFPKK